MSDDAAAGIAGPPSVPGLRPTDPTLDHLITVAEAIERNTSRIVEAIERLERRFPSGASALAGAARSILTRR